MIEKDVQFMDISKLSRSTQKAKKLIAKVLGIDFKTLKFEKKRVILDPKKPLETIENILGKKINEKEIDTELVIQNICGSDGAAKILANSMLTKSKKPDGFKKLAKELKEIEYGESADNTPLSKLLDKTIETKIAETTESTEDQTLQSLLEKYIANKKRGKKGSNKEKESNEEKGSDGKDAREIDFLKLLCAALVLVAINKLKENETPKESLPASSISETQEEIPASSSISETPEGSSSSSGLETGSVNEEEAERKRQEEKERRRKKDFKADTGLDIETVRIVGNVDWGENTRYVLSQDGKQLIIYPAFKSDMNLGYIANHLYRIAGKTEISYPDDQEYFPTDRTVVVSKLSDDEINKIIKAKTNEKILEWKDFEAEKLNNYVHSLDESGNLSKNWLTYGKAMTMTEDVWKEIFAKEENTACDYIAKELPNITKQSKTFTDLQAGFNSVMKKEEVLSIIELLQNIKNNFENPSNLDLPTKDEINNQGYHLTDDAYEALSNFFEKVKDLYKKEKLQKEAELNIEKVRIVGKVDWGENTRYVLSQDGKQLIIYPAFAGTGISLNYIANHLYRIAGQDRSYYFNNKEDFPTEKTISVSKLSDAAINGIINSKKHIVKWEDFEKKELNYVHSLDESGNLSKNWLTYGKAMEMEEKDWNAIFQKENAREKANYYIAGGLSRLSFNTVTEEERRRKKDEKEWLIIRLFHDTNNYVNCIANFPTQEELKARGCSLTDDVYEDLSNLWKKNIDVLSDPINYIAKEIKDITENSTTYDELQDSYLYLSTFVANVTAQFLGHPKYKILDALRVKLYNAIVNDLDGKEFGIVNLNEEQFKEKFEKEIKEEFKEEIKEEIKWEITHDEYEAFHQYLKKAEELHEKEEEEEAAESHPSDQAPQFPQQQGQGGYGQQQQGQPSSSSLSPEEQNKINEIQALTKALNDEYNTIYTKYRGKSKGSANFIEICRSVSEDVKRFQDPELRRILVNGRVDAGMDVKTAILQPFVKVIEQLYAYYENIDTSVAKAEKFIQELESLKFDSESYKSAKANLTAAVDKHKKLKEELVEFQTKQMPKVNTGTFDFVPPRL